MAQYDQSYRLSKKRRANQDQADAAKAWLDLASPLEKMKEDVSHPSAKPGPSGQDLGGSGFGLNVAV